MEEDPQQVVQEVDAILQARRGMEVNSVDLLGAAEVAHPGAAKGAAMAPAGVQGAARAGDMLLLPKGTGKIPMMS